MKKKSKKIVLFLMMMCMIGEMFMNHSLISYAASENIAYNFFVKTLLKATYGKKYYKNY